MKNKTCDVVHDLLPLVIDGVSSDASRELVEAHLSECAECSDFNRLLRGEELLTIAKSESDIPFFRKLARRLILTALLISAMIAAFCVNLSGAWYGGPASIGQFVVTLIYIAAVTIFIIATRHWRPFMKASLILSSVSLAISLICMICRLTDAGFILVSLLSAPISVPFYGLRLFLDWDFTYIVSTALCAIWLAVGMICRRLAGNPSD